MTTTQTTATNISRLPHIVAALRTIAEASETETRRDSIMDNIDAVLVNNPSNKLLRKLRGVLPISGELRMEVQEKINLALVKPEQAI